MKRGIQTKIAKMVGVSDAYISQLLHGHRNVSSKVAQKLATATKTNPLIWLYGTNEEKRDAIRNFTDG